MVNFSCPFQDSVEDGSNDPISSFKQGSLFYFLQLLINLPNYKNVEDKDYSPALCLLISLRLSCFPWPLFFFFSSSEAFSGVCPRMTFKGSSFLEAAAEVSSAFCFPVFFLFSLQKVRKEANYSMRFITQQGRRTLVSELLRKQMPQKGTSPTQKTTIK